MFRTRVSGLAGFGARGIGLWRRRCRCRRADVEAFGGDGGGVLEDEWGDSVGFGADEEGALHDGGVVDAVGEVEGFGAWRACALVR